MDTNLIFAVMAAAAIAFAAYHLKFLSRSGAWAAALLGAVVLGLGGWAWVWPLLAFFVSSSLLSKARQAARGRADEEAKGSRRDAAQVLANGGVAGLAVILDYTGGGGLFPVYLGALAAANADTWATETGLLWGRRPRSVIR
ncbi:MAG: DUF92 domain-containing protein, partial [Candidatus Zixiibacteriota bacterium]